MILASLKNFFKSLGFYFIPLGIMAFFIVICLAHIVPEGIEIVKGTYLAIAARIGSTTIDWNEIQPILLSKVMGLINEDPTSILNNPDQLINILQETATDAFGPTIGDVTTVCKDCLTQLSYLLIRLVVVAIVSIFIGFITLKVLLRKYLTDSNIFKAILVSILDALVIVGIFVLITYLLAIDNKTLFWIALILTIIGVFFISLLEAYLFYGIRKVKFTKIFNIKNFFLLILADLIQIVLAVGVFFLTRLIPDAFVSYFVLVPFLELVICIIGLNAETYAREEVKKAKIERKINEGIEQAK